MFYKVKTHWVFVSFWIKGMRSQVLTNKLAHIKVTKSIVIAMFLKYI